MTTEGVDFSDSRPGGAAIAAAGKTFVVRYVPYGGYTKGLTAAEIVDYQAHGLDIALVFESTTQRALSGQAAGAADARTAASAAAGLGFPDTSAIYFAVDFDIGDSGLPAVDAYLQGAAMILGAARVGVYGGRRVVAHCKAAGTARWLWQTYAWSSGTVVAGIHLYQHLNGQTINGGSVDLDRAMQADFGQWAAPLQGGTAGGVSLMGFPVVITTPLTIGTVSIPAGVHARRLVDAADIPVSVAQKQGGIAVEHVGGSAGYQVNLISGGVTAAHFVGADTVTFTPVPTTDCTAQVKAATDPLNAKITSLQTSLASAELIGAQHEWDREFTGTAGAKVTPLARP